VSQRLKGRKSQIWSYFMKSKGFGRTVCILAGMVVAVGAGAPAQTPEHVVFSGTINDFTPATGVGGPWEVRGHWSLIVKGPSGKADFSAALTMERSDQGVILNGGGDLNNPADRMAHTHNITLVNGALTPITNGYEWTGPATITANGTFPPPFGSAIPTLTIDITGGNTVPFSNITLLFGAPASGHFGMAPLHGVVRTQDKGDPDRH
jgi:hypothetical protein